MQHTFTMKKGTEFPERFAGLVITQTCPVDEAKDAEEFGRQAFAAVGGDGLTAQAIFNGRFFLEHQKDVKEFANSKDLKDLSDDEAKQKVVDFAATRVPKIRLREQSDNAGQPKKLSPKQKETQAKAGAMDSLLSMLTPEQRAIYDAKIAEALGTPEAGVAAATADAAIEAAGGNTEAPAEEPATV